MTHQREMAYRLTCRVILLTRQLSDRTEDDQFLLCGYQRHGHDE